MEWNDTRQLIIYNTEMAEYTKTEPQVPTCPYRIGKVGGCVIKRNTNKSIFHYHRRVSYLNDHELVG